jgi:hypothetical protein
MGSGSSKKKMKNSFEEFTNEISEGFGTLEGKCELIGYRYFDLIKKGKMTSNRVFDDIIAFTRSHNNDPKEAQYCWLSLHLGLGLCFYLKIADKNTARRFLIELLQYSRGIDMGLFMRDFMHYENLSDSNEALHKALYIIKSASGLVVNFTDNKLGDKLFKGPARVVYNELVQQNRAFYLDLPIGHPTLLLTSNGSTDNHIGTQCLTLACENLKPHVVLILLQYGATPHGKPLEHVLRNLGSRQIIEEASGRGISENPVELLGKCLTYLLRSIKKLHITVEGYTVADLEENFPHTYYLPECATYYLPDEYYRAPRKLKQLCRWEIRENLRRKGRLPSGLQDIPNLSEHLTQYLQLVC